MQRRSQIAVVVSVVAAVVGLGSAAVSAYWAAGGTALLDTIGGDIERWGRQREASAVAGLWVIVALKTLVALAAPVVAVRPRSLPRWTSGRVPRILSWIAAVTLVAYGGLLTVTGLVAQSGLVQADPDTDRRALAWHAYFWDPWFFLWGLAFIVSLWLTRLPANHVPTRAPTSRRCPAGS